MQCMEKKLRSFVSVPLLACAIVLPIWVIPLEWVTLFQGKMLFALACISVATLAWLFLSLKEKHVHFNTLPIIPATALLAVAYGISAGANGFLPRSIFGSGSGEATVLIVCLWLVVLVLISSVASREVHLGNVVVRSVLLGGILLSCVELAHLLLPDQARLFLPSRIANPFGTLNELAIMSGFLLYFCIALLDTSYAKKIWSAVLSAGAVLSGILLFILNSSVVWGVLGVMILLFVSYRTFRAKGIARAHAVSEEVWRIVIALTCIVLAFTGPFIVRYLPEQFQVSSFEVRPSLEGTLAIAEQSLKSGSSLFGTGPNTFARAWNAYKPAGINQTLFWNLEFGQGFGSIPTSIATLGIVGVVGWLGFLLGLAWTLRIVLARKHEHVLEDPLLAVSFAILFLLVFHVVYIPNFTLSFILFLLIGAYIALSPQPEYVVRAPLSLKTKKGIVAVVGLTIFIASACAAIAGTARALVSELLVNKSVSLYASTQQADKAARYLRYATRIYPENDRAHRASVELGLLQMQALSASAVSDQKAQERLQETLKQTISHALAAITIDKGEFQNWLELANLYQELAGVEVPGAYEQAQNAYAEAQRNNPTNPLPYVHLARLAMLHHNSGEALKHIDRAIALKPELGVAHYVKSEILTERGDLGLAILSANAAAQYASDDSLAWHNLGSLYFRTKQYVDAVLAEEKAVAISPHFANAQYTLAQAYMMLGAKEKAIELLRDIVRKNPAASDVRNALETLQSAPATQTASSTELSIPQR